METLILSKQIKIEASTLQQILVIMVLSYYYINFECIILCLWGCHVPSTCCLLQWPGLGWALLFQSHEGQGSPLGQARREGAISLPTPLCPLCCYKGPLAGRFMQPVALHSNHHITRLLAQCPRLLPAPPGCQEAHFIVPQSKSSRYKCFSVNHMEQEGGTGMLADHCQWDSTSGGPTEHNHQ